MSVERAIFSIRLFPAVAAASLPDSSFEQIAKAAVAFIANRHA